MSFEMWKEAQYRSADIDGLEARKAAIADELVNAESEIKTSDLEAEAERCMDAIARIEKAAEMRSKEIAAVASGAGKAIEERGIAKKGAVDEFDTVEYRNAFMAYIQRGNAGTVSAGVTLSTDNPPQVPTTMQKEIIKAMRDFGTIWNEVRKLNVKGGTWFRVIDIIPTASWLTENNVSADQKVTSDDMVSFSFFELECRMSQSLLAAAVTFEDFQAMFVPAVAEAIVTAIEAAIMNGNGTSQPLGILKDTRVTTLQTNDPRKVTTVEMTAAEFASWQKWRSNVKSKIPTKYRTGKWYMNFASFDCYIDTMADDNHAPVSTSYDAVTGEEISRLCGFKVEKVQDAILPDFDSADAGDVVAIYGDMKNYAVNTQPGMPMSTVRWIDHDNNKEKIKCLTALDGKVLDPYGFILIKKKASA